MCPTVAGLKGGSIGVPSETPSTTYDRSSAGISSPIIGDAGTRRTVGLTDADWLGDVAGKLGVLGRGGAGLAGTASFPPSKEPNWFPLSAETRTITARERTSTPTRRLRLLPTATQAVADEQRTDHRQHAEEHQLPERRRPRTRVSRRCRQRHVTDAGVGRGRCVGRRGLGAPQRLQLGRGVRLEAQRTRCGLRGFPLLGLLVERPRRREDRMSGLNAADLAVLALAVLLAHIRLTRDVALRVRVLVLELDALALARRVGAELGRGRVVHHGLVVRVDVEHDRHTGPGPTEVGVRGLGVGTGRRIVRPARPLQWFGRRSARPQQLPTERQTVDHVVLPVGVDERDRERSRRVGHEALWQVHHVAEVRHVAHTLRGDVAGSKRTGADLLLREVADLRLSRDHRGLLDVAADLGIPDVAHSRDGTGLEHSGVTTHPGTVLPLAVGHLVVRLHALLTRVLGQVEHLRSCRAVGPLVVVADERSSTGCPVVALGPVDRGSVRRKRRCPRDVVGHTRPVTRVESVLNRDRNHLHLVARLVGELVTVERVPGRGLVGLDPTRWQVAPLGVLGRDGCDQIETITRVRHTGRPIGQTVVVVLGTADILHHRRLRDNLVLLRLVATDQTAFPVVVGGVNLNPLNLVVGPVGRHAVLIGVLVGERTTRAVVRPVVVEGTNFTGDQVLDPDIAVDRVTVVRVGARDSVARDLVLPVVVLWALLGAGDLGPRHVGVLPTTGLVHGAHRTLVDRCVLNSPLDTVTPRRTFRRARRVRVRGPVICTRTRVVDVVGDAVAVLGRLAVRAAVDVERHGARRRDAIEAVRLLVLRKLVPLIRIGHGVTVVRSVPGVRAGDIPALELLALLEDGLPAVLLVRLRDVPLPRPGALAVMPATAAGNAGRRSGRRNQTETDECHHQRCYQRLAPGHPRTSCRSPVRPHVSSHMTQSPL